MKDKKSISRGPCRKCDCDDYTVPDTAHICAYCGHYPTDHQNLDRLLPPAQDASASAARSAAASAAVPGPVEVDAETLRAIEEAQEPEYECVLCFDVLPVSRMYTVDCPASHRFCFDCLSRFAKLCIKEGVPVLCPAPDGSCEHVLADDEVLQIAAARADVLTQADIEKYQEQTLLRGIQSIPGIIGCPTPGCKNWVVPSDSSKKERCVCEACGNEFCSLCKRTYHYNTSCEEVFALQERWLQWCLEGRDQYHRSKTDAIERVEALQRGIDQRNQEILKRYHDMLADEQYKLENGRLCPKCKRVIIKDGGCDSMVCGRDYHGGNVQVSTHSNHAAIPEIARTVVHTGVACDSCHTEIVGLRFTCVNCPALDLCERCETEATLAHPNDHVFHVITNPEDPERPLPTGEPEQQQQHERESDKSKWKGLSRLVEYIWSTQ
eukprot:m51a1_g5959 hypothetical protein (437) ;mRNA; f:159750-161856